MVERFFFARYLLAAGRTFCTALIQDRAKAREGDGTK